MARMMPNPALLLDQVRQPNRGPDVGVVAQLLPTPFQRPCDPFPVSRSERQRQLTARPLQIGAPFALQLPRNFRLVSFMRDSVEPSTVVHTTDAWLGNKLLQSKGYRHEITFLRVQIKSPSDLLPRVYRVIPLLKLWLLRTPQAAVSVKRLDYYFDEFTFQFNRRGRSKLFFRLVQHAVAVDQQLTRHWFAQTHPNHKTLGLPESTGYPHLMELTDER